jgi:ribonuclease-3
LLQKLIYNYRSNVKISLKIEKLNCCLTKVNARLPILKNSQLLTLALTHRSYVNENPSAGEDNERLEFLGDAVLGFTIGELLYKLYPEMNEAQLTRLRSRLVDEQQLGKLGAELGLGKIMRLGKGAEKDRGRENIALLADTFEATIGAYLLDAGIEAVREYIQPIFSAIARDLVHGTENNPQETLIDSKNRFQQWALSKYAKNPTYQIIQASGPDHAKEFTAQVSIDGMVFGIGKGRRKQEAQKRAAEAALELIKHNY